MATYFRSDGWVKSAIGPAVSGAQIFVCLQPANLTFPPTPLADLFSDVNGLVPITQPIQTDGFGHYDFYTLAGIYTLIVGLNGQISQVYPDQNIGAVGAGTYVAGTGISIVGSVISASLVAGPNITIVGNVISAVIPPPTGLQLQTNGVDNGSQALLDLNAGTGVTLTDNGFGQVTIASSIGSPSVDCMFSAGVIDFFNITASGAGSGINDVAFAISAFRFLLAATLNPITSITAQVTSPNPPQQWGAAIYDKNGNLLWQSGPLVVNISGYTLTSWTVPSLTLPAGEYYLALSQDSHSFGGVSFDQSFAGWTNVAVNPSNAPPGVLNSGVPVLAGVAANPTTSGASFPATLGAVTPWANTNNWTLPFMKFSN